MDAKFLQETLHERFPSSECQHYIDILSAFKDLCTKKCDLVLIDCEGPGFKSFSAIKLIKSFSKNTKVIATTRTSSRSLALKAVIEGADNYYIIRYNYKNMFEKVLSLYLGLVSPIEYIRKYTPKSKNQNLVEIKNQITKKVS